MIRSKGERISANDLASLQCSRFAVGYRRLWDILWSEGALWLLLLTTWDQDMIGYPLSPSGGALLGHGEVVHILSKAIGVC